MAHTAILEAAEEVFAEEGLHARMETIAQRAGVAVGTLYNHFADRDALLASLFDAHRAETFERLQAAVTAHEAAPLREFLEAIVQAMVDLAVERARMRALLAQLDAQAPRRVKEFGQRLGELLGPALARARKAGALAPDPDGLQVVALHGLVRTAFAVHHHDPRRLPAEKVTKFVVGSFLDGAAPRGGKK